MNFLFTFLSVIAALASAYFAFKTVQQNQVSQMPILDPKIIDVSNPHILKMNIENVGNGLAKNIKAKLSHQDIHITFNSDLMPRKHQDYIVLTLNHPIDFENGKNPLFDGEVLFTYKDVFDKTYSMRAGFKPDTDEQRKALGHIDKNFQGLFY